MLEKDLRIRVDKLNKVKHERQKAATILLEEDQKLCEILSETPYYIPVSTVPTKEQLDGMQDHIDQMKKEKVSAWVIVNCYSCLQ